MLVSSLRLLQNNYARLLKQIERDDDTVDRLYE